MTLRYLVGPTSPRRALTWRHERASGRCLTFDSRGAADLLLRPGDSWEDFRSRWPAGFEPDFLALDLGYTTVPSCLWEAPLPLVALAADWQLQWHYLRLALPRCQVVFTDCLGVEVMHRAGISQARPLPLFGLQEGFTDLAPEPPQRDIDVLFAGNVNPAVQGGRLPWLGRVARLSHRWRVVIAQGLYDERYRRLLGRARVVFNRSLKGECNLRVGEACSSGTLLFMEAGNPEMEAAGWRHGVDCVFYGEDDLESLLEHYLAHEDERRAVAEAGRRKALAESFAASWERGLRLVEQEW